MTHETEEQWLRSSFGAIADTAVVDDDLGRRDARRALRRRTRRRAQRRGAVTALVVVALVIGAFALSPGRSSGHSVKTVHPAPSPSSGTTSSSTTVAPLRLIKALDEFWAPEPIAFDGHDMWLARKVPAAVVVERRNPTSGALLASIDVPQESVFSIAVDGAGSVWVAGGGDGGVPTTTVSRIDASTQRVVLTHTLANNACSCQIVAGAGGVWIGGNGSQEVLRLDQQTGEVAAAITLSRPSRLLAVVGDRVDVELDASLVSVIDPATNRVERTTASTDPLPSPYVVTTPQTVWTSQLNGSPSGGPVVLIERR